MNIIQEISSEQLDDFVSSHPHGHILQSHEWGEAQKAFGEPVYRIGIEENGTLLACATLIAKTFKGSQHYMYCPRGPLFASGATQEVQKEFLKAIANLANEKKSIFLRVNPELTEKPSWLAGFKKADHEIEPRETVILDLLKSEDQLLSEMKSKTRYNIRLAEKKGVRVVSGSDEKLLREFLRLNKETTERDKFKAHENEYYQKQLAILGPKNMQKVYVAFANINGKEQAIAANLVSYFGKRATYMHGASGNEGRNLMPTFALQWQAMRDAKSEGYTEYDFWGVAPSDDPSHPWAGITRFKKGFSQTVVQYIGAYDLPYRKALYALYRLYRKVR